MATYEEFQQAVKECCELEERALSVAEFIKSQIKTEEWMERIERMVRTAIAKFQTRAVCLDKALEEFETGGTQILPSFSPCEEMDKLLIIENLLMNESSSSLITATDQSIVKEKFINAVKENKELLVSFILMEVSLTPVTKMKAFAEAVKLGFVPIVDMLITKGDVNPSIHDDWAIKHASENFNADLICRLLLDNRVGIPQTLYKQIISRPYNPMLTDRLLMNPSLNVNRMLQPEECLPRYLDLTVRLLEDPRFTATEAILNQALDKNHYKLLEICLKTIVPTTGHLSAVCEYGSLPIVDLLLRDMRVTPTFTMLLNSCQNGNSRIAIRLLQDGRIIPTNEIFNPVCILGLDQVFDQLMLDRRIAPTFESFLAACEHNNLYIIERIKPLIDPFYNNYQALRIARNNNNQRLIKLLMDDPRYDSFEISEKVAGVSVPVLDEPRVANVNELPGIAYDFE